MENIEECMRSFEMFQFLNDFSNEKEVEDYKINFTFSPNSFFYGCEIWATIDHQYFHNLFMNYNKKVDFQKEFQFQEDIEEDYDQDGKYIIKDPYERNMNNIICRYFKIFETEARNYIKELYNNGTINKKQYDRGMQDINLAVQY